MQAKDHDHGLGARDESERSLRHSRRARLRAVLRTLQTGWSIVGVSLVLLLGIELAASLLGRRLMINAGRKEIRRYAKLAGAADSAWPEETLKATFARKMRWSPYVYWRSEPYSSTNVNVDQNGLRRTVQARVTGGQSSHEIRIFAMGGSTMWGSGARDSWTIPSILSRLLAEQGMRARITNYGQDGYVSTQEVIALLLELQRRNIPDLVIFYDGVNDVNAMFQNAKAGVTLNEIARRTEFRAQSDATLFTSLPSALMHSAIARLFAPDPLALAQRERSPDAWDRYTQELRQRGDFRAEYERRKADQGGSLTPAQKQLLVEQMVARWAAREAVRAYDANVAAVDALSREFGFDVLFYWQPVIFEKSALSNAESQLPTMHERFVQFFRINYGMIHRAIEGSSPEVDDLPHVHRSVRYLGDLFSAPRWQTKTAFRDFCHLLEQGNEAVVQAMLSDVVQRIDDPRPPSRND